MGSVHGQRLVRDVTRGDDLIDSSMVTLFLTHSPAHVGNSQESPVMVEILIILLGGPTTAGTTSLTYDGPNVSLYPVHGYLSPLKTCSRKCQNQA